MNKIFYLFIALSAFLISSCGSKQRNTNQSPEKTQAIDSIYNFDELAFLIRKDPHDAKLFVERAKLYVKQNNFEEAINDIEIATKIDSLNSSYYIHLADLYLKSGKSGKSKETLERCLKFNPQTVEAMHRLANLYFYVREYTKSMEWLNKTQEADHNYAQIYFTKGMIYKETGDTSMAIRNFQIAVEKEPDYYDSYILLGLLYADKKDSLAIAYYQNAIRIIPTSIEAHYNLAMFYQLNAYENRAIHEYSIILNEIDSLQPNIYFNLGYIYMQYSNEYKKAITNYTNAIRLNETYVPAYYNRGYCYEQLRIYNLARKDYKKSLEIAENYELAIEGLNRLDRLNP